MYYTNQGGAEGGASGAMAPPIFRIYILRSCCQFVQKCNKNVVEKNNPPWHHQFSNASAHPVNMGFMNWHNLANKYLI